jgi:hypothetical protein
MRFKRKFCRPYFLDSKIGIAFSSTDINGTYKENEVEVVE